MDEYDCKKCKDTGRIRASVAGRTADIYCACIAGESALEESIEANEIKPKEVLKEGKDGIDKAFDKADAFIDWVDDLFGD